MFDTSAFSQGLALGLGMFVCPGPKDVVILRQALLRRSPGELLVTGVGSDALLILLGMAGVSAVLREAPALQRAAMWIGVVLMVWHAALAAHRSLTGCVPQMSEPMGGGLSGRSALLVVSFLNPVAWLDTVLVIGTAGAVLPDSAQPSYFAGAVAASAAWFCALTLGARFAVRWMAKLGAWQIVDAFVATAMIGLALHIGSGLA